MRKITKLLEKQWYNNKNATKKADKCIVGLNWGKNTSVTKISSEMTKNSIYTLNFLVKWG